MDDDSEDARARRAQERRARWIVLAVVAFFVLGTVAIKMTSPGDPVGCNTFGMSC